MEDIEDLKARIFDLEQEHHSLVETIQDKDYTINNLTNQNRELESKINRLNGELQGKQYEYDCEYRKRKEAEENLYRRRMGHF